MRDERGEADSTLLQLRRSVGALSVLAPFLHRLLGSAGQAEQWLFNGIIFGTVLIQGIFGLSLMLAPWRHVSRGNVRRNPER